MKKIALLTIAAFMANPLAALAEGEVVNAKPSENTKTMSVGYTSGELGHASHQNDLYDLIASNPTASSSPRSTSSVNNERHAIASTQSADLPDPPAASAPLADPNDPNSPPAQPTESQVEKFVREAAERARKEAERAMANFDPSAPTESGQLPDPPAGVAPMGQSGDPNNAPANPAEGQLDKAIREAGEKARKEAERAMANFDPSAPTESGQLTDPSADFAPGGDSNVEPARPGAPASDPGAYIDPADMMADEAAPAAPKPGDKPAEAPKDGEKPAPDPTVPPKDAPKTADNPADHPKPKGSADDPNLPIPPDENAPPKGFTVPDNTDLQKMADGFQKHREDCEKMTIEELEEAINNPLYGQLEQIKNYTKEKGRKDWKTWRERKKLAIMKEILERKKKEKAEADAKKAEEEKKAAEGNK